LDSVVVTHRFHPLFGQQLGVLRVRHHASGRLYVCDGGVLGSITLPEDATDRGTEPAERPLSFEVLVELVAVVAAVAGQAGREGER
jgi:hypothetical protein